MRGPGLCGAARLRLLLPGMVTEVVRCAQGPGAIACRAGTDRAPADGLDRPGDGRGSGEETLGGLFEKSPPKPLQKLSKNRIKTKALCFPSNGEKKKEESKAGQLLSDGKEKKKTRRRGGSLLMGERKRRVESGAVAF